MAGSTRTSKRSPKRSRRRHHTVDVVALLGVDDRALRVAAGTVRSAAGAAQLGVIAGMLGVLVHASSEEDDAAVAEQPRTLLDEIGGPEVTRRAAQHAITAVLDEADPELSVRPLFAPLLAKNAVDAHVGHLARSFQQLFGSGRSGRPLTEELLRSWHADSAGRCTRRQLDAVSAHVMNGFTLACPDEEAVGRVGAYFGTYFDAIQRVFLAPDELRLTDAERPARPLAPR
jgi:hypothetical protein